VRAIIRDNGTPILVDRPEPGISSVQVRVRTRAAALNNADLSASGDGIAGFEFAGVIEAAGDDAPEEMLGARVMGIALGAFAEIVAADHRLLLMIPEGLDFAHASALPTALSTEYGALRRSGLRTGDVVLITAATSGIALIGLQVARAMGAGVVLGTTRTEDRADLLLRAGADHAIVLDGGVALADRVYELSGGVGADVVLDHVRGAGLADAFDASRFGRRERRAHHGTDRRDRPVPSCAPAGRTEVGVLRTHASRILEYLMAGVTADLLDDVAAGRIRAIIDSEVSFTEADRAYDRLASGSADGKVVLTLD
jgi:NADPH:quinone reductase